MPKEVSLAVLGIVNIVVMASSCAAIGFVIARWWKGRTLVPFAERDATDAGGVFRLIRHEIARHRGLMLPAPTENPAEQFASDVRLGLIGFLVAFVPMIVIHIYLQMYVTYEHDVIKKLLSDRSLATFSQVAFATVVLAPILEEFIFRNLLQGLLEVNERMLVNKLGKERHWVFGVLPILFSSLAFAGMHWGQGAAPLPLFPFALLLGYLYFQTHRLTPSIVAHMALNGFTMIQLWFLPG